jgi:hypothetical protein
MKIIIFTIFIIVNCFFHPVHLSAQVKTKIFPNGIPEGVSKKSYPYNDVLIAAPANFESLKQTNGDAKSLSEYKAKFAEVINVDYDLLSTAKEFKTTDKVVYSMKLTAAKALNVSIQFSEFQLSPNAILSIYTDFELTDSITSKENNPASIWATRIYQGNEVYLSLSVPILEIHQIKLRINKVGFGFRQIGGGFFGNPGTSGNCNINVVCPAGNGWENERNSVALIVSGGNEICTGTLVMNTCGTNIPYLLTANHCLNSNVSNWVFQFQTWSNDCATNTGWREDVQFNGCQLRANNAVTDFALVELNQIPAANSGINYSGWTRDPNPAITTTAIHHPMGDLMKISHDFQAPVSVSWLAGANNHWRAAFDQGIVQHGSSGSALYDENHRILGQLHGNQNNICNIGDNNCFCNVQLPSIGEYGRFDISWTGGGTNATRLSNWLDPANTGALTTNTTNINALFANFPNSPTLTISGSPTDSYICSGSSTYTLNGLPANVNATITWSVSNTSAASIPNPSNGTSVVVTKTGNAVVTLTATVTPCGQQPITVNKIIMIGAAVDGNYYISSNYHQPFLRPLYTNNSPIWLPANQSFGVTAFITSPNVQSASWVRGSNSYPFNWSSTGTTVNFSGTSAPTAYTTRNGIFTITAQTTCGTYVGTYTWPVITQGWGFRIQMNPNPATDNLVVSITDESSEVKALPQDKIVAMTLYSLSSTVVVKRWTFKNNQSRFNLNVSDVKNGHYILVVQKGKYQQSEQIFIE